MPALAIVQADYRTSMLLSGVQSDWPDEVYFTARTDRLAAVA